MGSSARGSRIRLALEVGLSYIPTPTANVRKTIPDFLVRRGPYDLVMPRFGGGLRAPGPLLQGPRPGAGGGAAAGAAVDALSGGAGLD